MFVFSFLSNRSFSMSVNPVLVLLLLLTVISAIQIPFLENATLIAVSNSNSTIINNQICIQCLCALTSSYLALNCFPNNTCQFFSTYPRTYTVQTISQARLYFLQRALPNPSQCCMPNTSYLMDKIYAANWIAANLSGPRCMTFDNHGYLITISAINKTIVRLFPTNLTIVSQSAPVPSSGTIRTVVYYNEAYYVGFDTRIVVLNSSDFTVLRSITASVIQGVRDIMLIHNGQTLVVLSTTRQSILFFNRTNNYSLINEQSVNYSTPHGLMYINDSFFYVTSWG